MTSLGDQDEALATLQGLGSITLVGKDLDATISGRNTDSTVVRSIAEVSTFELVVQDSDRKVARSGIFGQDVTVHVGGYPYCATSISKSGESLTIEFEDEIVTRLQEYNHPYKVAPGVMTHVEFVRHLLRPHKWIKFHTIDAPHKYGVEKSLTPLNRGTPAGKSPAKPEGTWSAINRIGKARGWRTFIRGVDELWYVPDAYLFNGSPAYTMSEDETWVDDIDYDMNIRKKVATLTATVRAAEFAIPPGVCVLVRDPGPTYGKWLVQDITRNPISNPQATVTLIRPTPSLPEPVPNPTGSGESLSNGYKVSSNKATAVAQYAIAAGFRGDELLTAVEVSFAEEPAHKVNAQSPLNNDGSYDRGLWQINSKAHHNYSDADMYQGEPNAKAAWDISDHGRNWRPWTTYKSGAYKRYRKQAEDAIAAAHKANSSSGATVGLGSGGNAPSRTNSKKAADFVNEAMSQAGKPYSFGSEPAPTQSDPHSFDCSSLVAWAAERVGIDTSFPRNAEAQYELCVSHNTQTSVSRAIHIRGALLFKAGSDPEGRYGIGHVAISLGNGRDTFEAYSTGYALNTFHDANQFTRAGLIPGMRY